MNALSISLRGRDWKTTTHAVPSSFTLLWRDAIIVHTRASLLATCHTGSPGLKNSVLVRWGSLVVLLAPDEIPDGGDDDDGGKHNGSVVHGCGGDFAESGHAEERSGKGGPGCRDC